MTSLSLSRVSLGFPGGSEGKASACNVGDPGSIPESGRSPGEGNGNPLQYSCLGNPTERDTWWATVHGVAKSQIRLNYSNGTTCKCLGRSHFKGILRWVDLSESGAFLTFESIALEQIALIKGGVLCKRSIFRHLSLR